ARSPKPEARSPKPEARSPKPKAQSPAFAHGLPRCDPAEKHFAPSLPPLLFLGDSNAALY
ncbi:hypothetical protein, partial [Pantoea brenneri]|uniref:hypothetical protein n=1 Tax=Pantoea brenneri TaxID=472694 RepID=UPI00289B27E4